MAAVLVHEPDRGALATTVAPRARRPTQLDALTGVRFLFAFLVVCHHSLHHWFGDPITPVADFGYIGVDFFFVLSGFVLSWSTRTIGVRRFYWGRLGRIWPLHLLTAGVALALVGHGIGWPGGRAVIANLLLVQAWFPAPHTYFSLNQVSWSLSCEVLFYLLFPWLFRWLAAAPRRLRRRVAAAVVVLLLVYPGLFSLTIAPQAPAPHEWSTYVLPVWRLGEFMLGMIAALELRSGWRPRVSARLSLTATGMLSLAVLVVGLLRGGLPNRSLIEITGAVVAALVFATLASDELGGRRTWLASAPMVRLGASSYALFLVHGLVYAGLLSLGTCRGSAAVNAVAWVGFVALSIGVALVVHRWVEQPCENWCRAHVPAWARQSSLG